MQLQHGFGLRFGLFSLDFCVFFCVQCVEGGFVFVVVCRWCCFRRFSGFFFVFEGGWTMGVGFIMLFLSCRCLFLVCESLRSWVEFSFCFWCFRAMLGCLLILLVGVACVSVFLVAFVFSFLVWGMVAFVVFFLVGVIVVGYLFFLLMFFLKCY